MNTTKSTNELRIARNLIRSSSFDEDTKKQLWWVYRQMRLRIAEEHPCHISKLIDKTKSKFGIPTYSFFERIDQLEKLGLL